ncbi:MAG: TonB-dependent receptor plug domain-containing protein [Gammaproteobacteria bacterium]|nr:TonB-dependent receptor plug domain-containing protein [Gammaproteobacteria bacterium]
MKNKLFLLFPLIVYPLLTTTALAQEEASPDDSMELFNLLSILEAQTEIATKTKLNADHVPGMVTVLHGSDLEARGLRTVWEALRLVPGMDPTIDSTGIKQINTRGTGQVYSSGNVKILLNDTPVNPGKNGQADSVLNLPVEQIERIEVVRGPGSAVYGEFAYAGVINIITRDEGNRAFAAYGSFDTATVGLLHSWSQPENDFKLSLNLAGWKSDGADMEVTEDSTTNLGAPAFSHAPGSANEDAEARSAILQVHKANFSLNAHWLENGIGDHFGINQFLPPDPDKIVTEETHRSLEANYDKQVSPTLRTEAKLGYQRFLQVKKDQ